jgi:lipopolysaccharide transport system ATP-binding protein
MSSEVAIRARGLGKTYRIYSRPHHRLAHTLFPEQTARWAREFHALSGVDLAVHRGETVGIVGRNGSGKSTLLQIICGTLTPTAGELEVNGRIAALLELGAGFNPEFTGRENVFLNGAVMGLERREVLERFDAIAAFADIGDFIEQPVKTYSSGMYIRLAFAVAISSDPAILVVDEALSVGDEAFQRKCFARIEELKRGGCTILFVSHSAGSVVQLCDRAMLLDAGELLFTGSPKATVALYQRLLYAPPERRHNMRQEIRGEDPGRLEECISKEDSAGAGGARITLAAPDVSERYDPELKPASTVEYESRGARITDPHLVNEAGERVNVLVPGRPYRYRYRVEFSAQARQVHFGMMIKSITGVELFGMSSHAEGQAIETIDPGSVYEVEFRFHSHFLPGGYFMNAGVVGEADGVDGGFLHRVVDALMFKVERPASDRRKAGFYDLAVEPGSSAFRHAAEAL